MEAASLGRNISTLNESVFDRLYETHTCSSKMMVASTLECNKAKSTTLGSKTTSTLNEESVFDRLYNSHTASSKLKHRVTPIVIAKDGENSITKSRKNVSRQKPLHASAPARAPPQRPGRDDSLRLNAKPQTTPLSKPPTTSSKLRRRGGPSIISTDVETSSVESRENPSRRQPRAAAPALASPPIALQDDPLLLNVTLRTTLLYHKKYDSTEAFSDISSGLASLNLVQTFAEYEANRMTKRAVSGKVIDALFHRDFPPCDRWEINSCTVEELDPYLFTVEKHATWDWEDNYSVTQAKATIRFGKDEIKVEEYSFFRCWLKFGGKSCKKMYYGFQKKEKDVPSDLPLVSPKMHPSPPRCLGKVVA
jgi:hypothetical protein